MADSLSRVRSQSRGRSTPGDVLARRQHLLSHSKSSGRLASDHYQHDTDHNDNTSESIASSRSRPQATSSRRASGLKLAASSDMFATHSSSGELESAEQQLEELSALIVTSDKQTDTCSTVPKSQIVTQQATSDELYVLLAKKEKDLKLAAELGKLLLAKNEELSKSNERATEEYSARLEVSCVA